jgi:hypothetical protein
MIGVSRGVFRDTGLAKAVAHRIPLQESFLKTYVSPALRREWRA